MRPVVRLAEDRVSAALVWGGLAAVLLVGGAYAGLAVGMHAELRGRHLPDPPPRPAPRTIAAVRQTLIAVERPGLLQQREAEQRLSQWSWVDRDEGIVAIPVDEAARLLIGEALR